MLNSSITHFFKERAYAEGFSFIGIAKAEKMEPEAKRLEEWLNQNMHGMMGYMENHFDMRVDPTLLVKWYHRHSSRCPPHHPAMAC